MTQYWLMTPAEDWEDWKRESIISLKWNTSKSYLQYSREDLGKELKMTIRKWSDRAEQIIKFSKTMEIGDYIFLRKNDCIIAYGKAASDYIYNPDRQKKHIRKVEWISKGVWDIDKELPHKDLKDITNDPIKETIMEAVFGKE